MRNCLLSPQLAGKINSALSSITSRINQHCVRVGSGAYQSLDAFRAHMDTHPTPDVQVCALCVECRSVYCVLRPLSQLRAAETARTEALTSQYAGKPQSRRLFRHHGESVHVQVLVLFFSQKAAATEPQVLVSHHLRDKDTGKNAKFGSIVQWMLDKSVDPVRSTDAQIFAAFVTGGTATLPSLPWDEFLCPPLPDPVAPAQGAVAGAAAAEDAAGVGQLEIGAAEPAGPLDDVELAMQ